MEDKKKEEQEEVFTSEWMREHMKKYNGKFVIDDELRQKIKEINEQLAERKYKEEHYKNFDDLLQNRKGFADKIIETCEKDADELEYADYNIIARSITLLKKPFFYETCGKDLLEKKYTRQEWEELFLECYKKAQKFKAKEKKVINTNSINYKSKGKGIK